MRNFSKYLLMGLVFCGGMLQVTLSSAEPVKIAATARAGDMYAHELGQSLSDECLGGETGGQDTSIDQLNMQITNMNNEAQMSGNILNVASGSTLNNGANSIGQDAFSNANGLVTVIQNSGNQVLIQNDMVLNLFMK